MIIALLSLSANAQELVDYGHLLSPSADPAHYTAGGVGAPTVAWDPNEAAYVMFFESPYTPEYLATLDVDYEACRRDPTKDPVVWGIGRATSPDGMTWTPDAEPALLPAPDTFYPCVTAHPNVVYDGETWHLWFKAEQGWDPCPEGAEEPFWGCTKHTGVGYASSADGRHFTPAALPAIWMSGIATPRVLRLVEQDGSLVWNMFVISDGAIWRAFSDSPESSFRLWDRDGLGVADPIVRPGDLVGGDVLFNPAAMCSDEGQFPLEMWYGAREKPEDTVLSTSVRSMVANDPTDWFHDGTPIVEWPGSSGWRHWTVLRHGQAEYLVYYSDRDDVGINHIGVAATSLPADGSETAPHLCPDPFDLFADAGPAGNPETERPIHVKPPVVVAPPPCGCSATGAAMGWVPLLGLLLLRRRRE